MFVCERKLFLRGGGGVGGGGVGGGGGQWGGGGGGGTNRVEIPKNTKTNFFLLHT